MTKKNTGEPQPDATRQPAPEAQHGKAEYTKPLRFGHACATRPLEWPENANLVLAMRRPRWRTRPVLEAGGRSVPAAGPSDGLLNAYMGKAPRRAPGANDHLENNPFPPKPMSWETFTDRYRAEMRTPGGLSVLDSIIDIALASPERPLTVLCWERLDGPGAHPHCHRTVLVELLVERAQERGFRAESV